MTTIYTQTCEAATRATWNKAIDLSAGYVLARRRKRHHTLAGVVLGGWFYVGCRLFAAYLGYMLMFGVVATLMSIAALLVTLWAIGIMVDGLLTLARWIAVAASSPAQPS